MGRTRTSAALAPLLVLAALAVAPAPARAADADVTVRDNVFSPQEVRIDPGDTVTWSSGGTRTHDVTSDSGAFASGDMFRGSTFSHTFEKAGTYYYHCSFHGRAGKQGMWGVVVVGDPKPAEPSKGRPRIDVPADHATIQGAVDAAESGSTIVVAPGSYKGDVTITTDDLIVRGVDRYRTVLHGRDERAHGFLVEGADRVTIANLTVRNFTDEGISFVDSTRYTVKAIDAIDNRMHGVAAVRSYDGVVRSSFGWGSGEAAFYVAGCMGCGALLEHLDARASHAGIAAVNATGVTIRRTNAVGNGVGIVVRSAPGEASAGRGTLVVDNVVRAGGAPPSPPLRTSETFGIPRRTGIWLAGVRSGVVRANRVEDETRYGILVSASDGFVPSFNTVRNNLIAVAQLGPLAWDGAGTDNCFTDNAFGSAPAPPDVEERYGCERRPFAGEPYEPVQTDLASALPASLAEPTADPPEPRRPSCQKGRPGCHRH